MMLSHAKQSKIHVGLALCSHRCQADRPYRLTAHRFNFNTLQTVKVEVYKELQLIMVLPFLRGVYGHKDLIVINVKNKE